MLQTQSAPSVTEYTALAASVVGNSSDSGITLDNNTTIDISRALDDIKPVGPRLAE